MCAKPAEPSIELKDTFHLPEGPFSISYPDTISKESFNTIAEHLQLFKLRLVRRIK